MKIEQKHVKHKTWYTCVTVGEGDKAKRFGLRALSHGRYGVYIPFGGTEMKEFDTKEGALAFCEMS